LRRYVIGFAFTAISLLLLWRAINWSQTLRALRAAELEFIALAVACLLFSLAAKTMRWRLLLPAAASLTPPRLFRILHISYLLNNVLPARLGDVARIAMTARQPGVRVGHVVSSLVTERVADVVILLACFLVVSPFLPVRSSYQHWLNLAWLIIAVLVAAILLVGVFQQGLARTGALASLARRVPVGHWLRVEGASFLEGWRSLFARRNVFQVWGLSSFAWVWAFAINYSLMQALNINAPITVAVLLTCTTNLAMLLPSSPGYIGVFHAAATLSLLPFGVSASTALSFAVLAHLVNVLPVSALGAAFLLWGRETAQLSLGGLRSGEPIADGRP
jgi:uncharacterized protein (TIRG00374 family)